MAEDETQETTAGEAWDMTEETEYVAPPIEETATTTTPEATEAAATEEQQPAADEPDYKAQYEEYSRKAEPLVRAFNLAYNAGNYGELDRLLGMLPARAPAAEQPAAPAEAAPSSVEKYNERYDPGDFAPAVREVLSTEIEKLRDSFTQEIRQIRDSVQPLISSSVNAELQGLAETYGDKFKDAMTSGSLRQTMEDTGLPPEKAFKLLDYDNRVKSTARTELMLAEKDIADKKRAGNVLRPTAASTAAQAKPPKFADFGEAFAWVSKQEG